MRLTCRLAILMFAPVWAGAQSPGLGLRPSLIRPGTDTLSMTGTGDDGTVPSPPAIQSLRPGTGSDAGALVETMVLEVRGSDGRVLQTIIDTLVMGATDLRLRRARALRLNADGQVESDIRVALVGGVVVQIRRRADKTDTTRLKLPPDGRTPFVTPYFAFRAAPLATTWRASFDMFVPAEDDDNSIRTVFVDSVQLQTIAARRVWMVHAHVTPNVQWTVGVDSITRDLVQYRVARRGSSPEDSYDFTLRTNKYFTSAPARPLASLSATEARAMRAVAGHYHHEGTMEVGSELQLRGNGRFGFTLAYGALDEAGAGQWRLDNGEVVLQSDGSARAPSVRLDSASGVATDSLVILVVDTSGRGLTGISIDASDKRESRITAQSARRGYTLNFEPGEPPTELGIGVDMLDFRVPFPLTGQVRAFYRFVLDRGDLGTRRFERERVIVAPGRLTLRINGRPMTYVRH